MKQIEIYWRLGKEDMSTESLKAEAFWAEMRSTAYLFSKSTWPTAAQTGSLIAELRHILGNQITTYPQTLGEFGIGPDTPYKMKKAFLGLDKPYCSSETDPNEVRFMKFMANKASQAQKTNWTWRITQEAEQKQLDGWYPFFVTLTVDPKNTYPYKNPEELWKKGRELRKYIRRIANISASLEGHPPPHKTPCKYKGIEYPYTPESNYVTYAAVLEHGKSQEHHHAHLMVWIKNIPTTWKVDPNHGRMAKYRTERECRSMRVLWPWAIASQKPALYFRTKGDIWSQIGHVTPIDKKTGQPIKINQVQAVGNYVTKYMQKGSKLWHHRMKCTRNLGMSKLQNLINRLDFKEVQALSWKPHNSNHHHLVSTTHSVPQGLIRLLAKRRVFSILYHSNQLDLSTVMKTNYEHYSRMLKSVRDGARPDRMPSTEFYDWVQGFLPEIKGYCEKRLLDSHKRLANSFPRNIYRIQPIVQPGAEHGSTLSV